MYNSFHNSKIIFYDLQQNSIIFYDKEINKEKKHKKWLLWEKNARCTL